MREYPFIFSPNVKAIDQSMKAEPLNSVAVLLFHDCVELFLALVSEYLNAGKTGQAFLEYWEAINNKLPDKDFAQKDSMKRLNTARTSLKHSGIQPSKSEVDAFRISVANFFDENTEKVFGISFRSISMAPLVNDDEVRQGLENADELFSQGNIEDAVEKVAIAFEQLLHNFEGRIFHTHQRFPFRPGKSSKFSFSSRFSHTGRSSTMEQREFASFVKDVQDAFDEINDRMKILSLEIDYRRFVKFKLIVPDVRLMMSGEYVASTFAKPVTINEYNFCYDFVIENALRLQEITF